MRTVLVLCLVGASALSGCRKRTAPEFYELEAKATILVERDGQDGLMSEEMDRLLVQLQAIPSSAVEGPKASALVAHLESERRAVREAHAVVAEVSPPPPQAPALAPPPPLPADAPMADAGGRTEADAGPSRPWANMTLAEFQARFGRCMESAGTKDVPGQGAMAAWAVVHTLTCSALYGLPDERTHHFFLFKDDRLQAERTEQQVLTVLDAGRSPAARPQAPTPYVLGMPVAGAEVPDAQ